MEYLLEMQFVLSLNLSMPVHDEYDFFEFTWMYERLIKHLKQQHKESESFSHSARKKMTISPIG